MGYSRIHHESHEAHESEEKDSNSLHQKRFAFSSFRVIRVIRGDHLHESVTLNAVLLFWGVMAPSWTCGVPTLFVASPGLGYVPVRDPPAGPDGAPPPDGALALLMATSRPPRKIIQPST